MKQNKSIRLMSILMILVMLSSIYRRDAAEQQTQRVEQQHGACGQRESQPVCLRIAHGQAQRDAQPAVADIQRHRAKTQRCADKKGVYRPVCPDVSGIERHEAQKQGEEHILLDGARCAAKDQKIKRNLGEDGCQKQPPAVGRYISRVQIALHDEKTVKRKGDPADAAQQSEIGKKRQSRVISDHGEQRRGAQRKRRQTACLLFLD